MNLFFYLHVCQSELYMVGKCFVLGFLRRLETRYLCTWKQWKLARGPGDKFAGSGVKCCSASFPAVDRPLRAISEEARRATTRILGKPFNRACFRRISNCLSGKSSPESPPPPPRTIAPLASCWCSAGGIDCTCGEGCHFSVCKPRDHPRSWFTAFQQWNKG